MTGTPTLDALSASACRWLAEHYDEVKDDEGWPDWVAALATIFDDDPTLTGAIRELVDLAELPVADYRGVYARIAIREAGLDVLADAMEGDEMTPEQASAWHVARAHAVREYLVNAPDDENENSLMWVMSRLAGASLLTDGDEDAESELNEVLDDDPKWRKP
jgi:hypothetical protein